MDFSSFKNDSDDNKPDNPSSDGEKKLSEAKEYFKNFANDFVKNFKDTFDKKWRK